MILLVGIMARISYVTSRQIYRQQIMEQTLLLTTLLAADIEIKYLDFIQSDKKNLASQYFTDLLSNRLQKMDLSNVFIFNRDLQIVIRTKPNISTSRLQINRKEIGELKPGSSKASLPFKAEDGQWYLWAFYRLNDHWYLGVQESVNRLAHLDELSWIFFFIGIGGIAITVITAWLLAGSIARPINKLVEFSRRIGSGNFRDKAPSGIKGDLRTLQTALIKMRDDLNHQHKEKENLLAQIAHEIRNPLGSIELLAGLVFEDIKQDDPSKEYLNKILEEVRGLKSQITDYLEYSRPMSPEPEPIDLVQFCNNIQNTFEKKTRNKNIQLDFEISADTVYFDRQHLRQIFFNLITNSVEVLPKGGKIQINSINEANHIKISITDNGPGIAEKDMSKIFDPFFTTKKDGAGLGLSISRKLCRENRAELVVKNNRQRGCTFSIHLDR